MEVVPAMSDASPFQRRDVAEWTHRDRLTGVLETARVETDHWAASSATAKHAYGKVVDSRNRSLPDGSAHQRQRQQLEVFQTKGPGHSLQVIRTQTVTSTNSSSSWRGTGSCRTPLPAITQDFGNLQLTLNPLDLSSEKSKASVGRSGSISSRRPPSRPRSLVGRVTPQDTSSQVLVESAPTTDVKEHSSSTSSKSSTVTLNGHLSISRKKSSSIEDLHNGVPVEGDGLDEGLKRSSKVRRSLQFPLKKLEARGGVCKLLQELEESSKRIASEGRIARRSFEALENVLKRNNSLTDSSNLSERDDEENQREQDGSNHHSVNSISIDDFSKKFNSSRNKFILEKRHSLMDSLDKSSDNEDVKSPTNETKNLVKRHSFVTVESLKEVRGRLKRLNSPLDGLDTESGMEELDDHDDGIGTDETSKVTDPSITEIPQLRVKSYVYGIEGISRSPRPPVLGTGSLESRTSNKASVNGSRSDEWYNRRKSYGFESVHGEEAHNKSSALISKYDEKNRLTSTDSGICRSSDQFAFPSWKRKQQESDSTKPSETEILQVSHSIPISRTVEENTVATLTTSRENVRKGRTTVVTFGGKSEQNQAKFNTGKEIEVMHRNGDAERTQTAYMTKKATNVHMEDRGEQPVTVSIPVVQEESSPSVVSRRLFFQQLAQGTSVSVERPSNLQTTKNENQSPSLIGSRKIDGDDWWRNRKNSTGPLVKSSENNEDWQASSKLSNGVMKRHSIAVDNSWKSFSNLNNSVHENLPGPTAPSEVSYRPTQNADESKRHSIAVDKLNYLRDDESAAGYIREDSETFVSRKQKRVEFCKTEVHFAAEPGRINIVETDEKPPPNNMFRRRRRHSTPAPDPAKNPGNLPEVRFGDSVYEKQLLGGTEEMEGTTLAPTHLPVLPVRVREEVHPIENNALSNFTPESNAVDDDDDHNNFESSLEPTPRSILKNFKKPKPYLIGEIEDSYAAADEPKEEKWGVRLRPVSQELAVPWRSTMGLSSRDEVMPTEYSGQSELQKLLRSLRPANPNRAKPSILFPQSLKREDKPSECSVAERVRQVEQVASESKGFSTRVNFGAGEATVVDEQQEPANQRLYKVSDYPKPVWQRREEAVTTRDGIKLKARETVSSLSQCLGVLPPSSAEPRGGTTTTITIDLSQPSSYNETYHSSSTGYHTNGVTRINPHEDLLSPSMIMRTIHHPNERDTTRSFASTTSSVNSFQETSQSFFPHVENPLNHQPLLTETRNCATNKDEKHFPSFKTNSQSDQHHQSSWLVRSARGVADGQDRVANCVENGYGKVNGVTLNSRASAERLILDPRSSERGCAEEVMVANQLDAWRALYCDIDSELSDDSEKADEEVRSYMSVEGDGVSSEVSGSWSRATGQRHLRLPPDRGVATGTSASEWPDDAQARPQQQQRSVATAMLSSYSGDSDRLRAVETLVSTRSGQPKITSISLRYGEDNQPAPTRTTEPFKFTSKTSISPERTIPSIAQSEVKQSYVKSSYTPHTSSSKTSISPERTIPSIAPSQVKQTYVKSSYTPQTSYPSPKVTPIHERGVAVSRTRLDANIEKKENFPHTRERKTLFDRTEVTVLSEPEIRSTAVVKQSSPRSESTPRGLAFSHFEKKPISSQKTNTHISKPLASCMLPTDSIPPSEVGTERRTYAKQLVHSDPPPRKISISALDKHSSTKTSQSSVSKQISNLSVTSSQNVTSQPSFKTVSSYEKKTSSPSNLIGSQSPKPSSLSSRHQDGVSDTPPTAPPSHRSSPRSRGSLDSQGSVKLDMMASCNRVTSNIVQRKDSKDKLAGTSIHDTESCDKSQSSLVKLDRLINGGSSVVSDSGRSSLVGREPRRVTRSSSRSPTPTKKVTPPSKNSKPKDFIGRVGSESPTYQNSRKSASPSNTLSASINTQHTTSISRLEEQPSKFPIYQNSGSFYDEPIEKTNLSNKPGKKQYDCGLDLIETDSAILEELTRAADQILQAVNGYTDEESRRASSDDDNRRFKDRRSSALGTISEAPLRKLADSKKESHKTNGTARRTQRVSSKTKLGPTSSTSSVESFTRETRRALVKPERSSSATTTSSRTARMVQRANSRELLLQTNASSSEDVTSGTESKKQRVPPPRRSRASSSSNKDPSSSSTKSKDKLKDGLDSSRSKERTSSSRGKTRDTSDSREARRKIPETKHPIKEKTIPAASGLTGVRDTRSSHARHSNTTSRTAKTTTKEKATPSRRRLETAVQT